MHSYRDIKFTASRTTSKLTAGKVCYQGQVVHNQTLNEAETRKAFADYARLTMPMGNLAIDSVGSFIAEEIATISIGCGMMPHPMGSSLKRSVITAARASRCRRPSS